MNPVVGQSRQAAAARTLSATERAPRRDPAECPHRQIVTENLASFVTCRLVETYLGEPAPVRAAVQDNQCEACCRDAAPTLATPNSAIASLLYETSNKCLHGTNRTASYWHARQLRDYATQWLGNDRPPSQSRIAAQASSPGPPRVAEVSQQSGATGSWRSLLPKSGSRMGLVGCNTATGLGFLNREIAVHLPVAKWLVTEHPGHATLDVPRGCCWPEYAPTSPSGRDLREWLQGLDGIIFAETPWLDDLPRWAREMGVRVACIPMWERTCVAHSSWLREVDVMLCPTHHTANVFRDWQARFGFTWHLIEIPWPVDTRRFRFQQRSRAERFLFVNGHGGLPGRRVDGTRTLYHRKGIELLAEAARLVPDIPIVVISQSDELPKLPRHVQILPPPDNPSDLYQHGDICLQPSHWEGVGLPLLECQAAGLPLLTTNAAPMHEYSPLATIPVDHVEWISVFGAQPVAAQMMVPEVLAKLLRSLHRQDIRRASQQARAFVRRNHSWKFARRAIRHAFAGAACQPLRTV